MRLDDGNVLWSYNKFYISEQKGRDKGKWVEGEQSMATSGLNSRKGLGLNWVVLFSPPLHNQA